MTGRERNSFGETTSQMRHNALWSEERYAFHFSRLFSPFQRASPMIIKLFPRLTLGKRFEKAVKCSASERKGTKRVGGVKKEGLTIVFKSSLRYFRIPCVVCRARGTILFDSKFLRVPLFRFLLLRLPRLSLCSRVRKTSFGRVSISA